LPSASDVLEKIMPTLLPLYELKMSPVKLYLIYTFRIYLSLVIPLYKGSELVYSEEQSEFIESFYTKITEDISGIAGISPLTSIEPILALLNYSHKRGARLALSPILLTDDFVGLRISTNERDFLPTLVYLDYCSLGI
jgi:hypothetical protein